jgi:hypothetical protein
MGRIFNTERGSHNHSSKTTVVDTETGTIGSGRALSPLAGHADATSETDALSQQRAVEDLNRKLKKKS